MIWVQIDASQIGFYPTYNVKLTVRKEIFASYSDRRWKKRVCVPRYFSAYSFSLMARVFTICVFVQNGEAPACAGQEWNPGGNRIELWLQVFGYGSVKWKKMDDNLIPAGAPGCVLSRDGGICVFPRLRYGCAYFYYCRRGASNRGDTC